MFSWKLCLSVQLVLLSSHPDPPLPPPPPPASDLSSPSLESGFMGLLRVKLFPLAFLSSPFLCKQPGLLSVVPLLLSSMLSWVQSLLQALLCGGLITWASFPSSVGLSCLLLVFADNLLSCFAFFFFLCLHRPVLTSCAPWLCAGWGTVEMLVSALGDCALRAFAEPALGFAFPSLGSGSRSCRDPSRANRPLWITGSREVAWFGVVALQSWIVKVPSLITDDSNLQVSDPFL